MIPLVKSALSKASVRWPPTKFGFAWSKVSSISKEISSTKNKPILCFKGILSETTRASPKKRSSGISSKDASDSCICEKASTCVPVCVLNSSLRKVQEWVL